MERRRNPDVTEYLRSRGHPRATSRDGRKLPNLVGHRKGARRDRVRRKSGSVQDPDTHPGDALQEKKGRKYLKRTG